MRTEQVIAAASATRGGIRLLPEGGTDAALFPAEPLDRSAALEEFRRAARPAREGDDELASLISWLQVFASLGPSYDETGPVPKIGPTGAQCMSLC